MTRYLLDTNIISNATKAVPPEPLVAWLADQPDASLFIASLTLAEVRRGILEKPNGKKRRELEVWFSGPAGLLTLFSGRVLPFNEKAALIWAELVAGGALRGRPRSAPDMMIAAVALANDCVVVTDNVRDFVGLKVLNPMR